MDYATETLVQGRSGMETRQTPDQVVMDFTRYLVVSPVASVENGDFWICSGSTLFTWKEQRDAQRFCDAVNRLVYTAATVDADRHPANFGETVSGFRAGTRPVQSDEWNRRRVLAENGVREQQYWTALEHYEAGLREMPAWPEGWFNAALLYEALGEWTYAIDRMRKYLELMPDAPDVKAANEKIIIWTEKERQ